MTESSRARILQVARGEFAQRGFPAARLQAIAERAGLTHPTLLYHFGSKERLYGAVIEEAMEDWAAMTSLAVAEAPPGFARLAALVDAGLDFFASHHDFVVIWRREAIEGGGRLEQAMADHLRPFFDRAVAFLRAEVAAGRLRDHDPTELMQLCYGAVMTYFSDAGFRARLLEEDPLGASARERFRGALTAMLRDALAPR
jgi:TetR/AcrR family transcriptional regulator